MQDIYKQYGHRESQAIPAKQYVNADLELTGDDDQQTSSAVGIGAAGEDASKGLARESWRPGAGEAQEPARKRLLPRFGQKRGSMPE